MAEIIMPKMGDAMTEGKVLRWYKKAGDAVKKGEPVLEIETDKVNLDLEAEQDGTIGEVAAKEGQVVPVGGTLAVISAPGEQPPQQRRLTDKKDSVKHTTGEYAEAIEMKAPRIDRTQPLRVVEGGGSGNRTRSSPLARKMAREMGVSLDAIQGSGPSGRIVARDIQGVTAAPKRAPARALEEKQIPLSAMRRTIAKRLAESTGPIPHFYLTAAYDVTNLMTLRQQMNEIVKISVNDFIVKAAALALR
ncbi:MAG TPA: biotin/lipoyl-containing protein, partial [Thermoanaerobaculia bacterium]|nr:biotin/lipoyl-containing protein [Thermoanaerobaculia bacterium]